MRDVVGLVCMEVETTGRDDAPSTQTTPLRKTLMIGVGRGIENERLGNL